MNFPDIKFEKPSEEQVKHWLVLLFCPFILLYDKTGRDKTGHILIGAFILDAIVFVIRLLTKWQVSFLCVFIHLALNLWAWLTFAMAKLSERK